MKGTEYANSFGRSFLNNKMQKANLNLVGFCLETHLFQLILEA